MQKWEYLVLIWLYSTNAAATRPAEKQPAGHSIYIFQPGGGPEEYYGELVEALNDLGSEGWELVSSDPLESTVMDGRFGWRQVSTPVRNRYVFKRPVPCE